MKKFFTLLLAVISTMTAFAQTEPAIELQAEVDGNTRTFSIGLATEGIKSNFFLLECRIHKRNA